MSNGRYCQPIWFPPTGRTYTTKYSCICSKETSTEEVEAFKTEMARHTMELLHGQSDSNKTQIRTTVNARNCVSDLDEACHIAANFRGCLEALFQCKKDDESPIVYQLTGETLEDWPSPSDLSHPFFQREAGRQPQHLQSRSYRSSGGVLRDRGTIGNTFRAAGPRVSPIHSVELALTPTSVTQPVVLLTVT